MKRPASGAPLAASKKGRPIASVLPGSIFVAIGAWMGFKNGNQLLGTDLGRFIVPGSVSLIWIVIVAMFVRHTLRKN